MSDIIKSIDENDVDTILADDIIFTGNLSFDKSLMIKGRFNGDIKAKGDLYIETNAVVEARIEANTVALKGHVNGNIYAYERVELFASSSVDGDITAPDVIMESGCTFNGICKMEAPFGEENGKK